MSCSITSTAITPPTVTHGSATATSTPAASSFAGARRITWLSGRRNRAADRLFSPEFRNRLTATITYKPLDWECALRVCRLELGRLASLLRDREPGPAVLLQFEPAAIEQIAREGCDRSARGSHVAVYGARHVRRAIERLVRDPLANLLASGRVADQDCIVVCASRAPAEPLRFRRKK